MFNDYCIFISFTDLRPWNFLMVDEGKHIKIHDFNEAKFMKWNDQTKKPCGFCQYWCNRVRQYTLFWSNICFLTSLSNQEPIARRVHKRRNIKRKN